MGRVHWPTLIKRCMALQVDCVQVIDHSHATYIVFPSPRNPNNICIPTEIAFLIELNRSQLEKPSPIAGLLLMDIVTTITADYGFILDITEMGKTIVII